MGETKQLKRYALPKALRIPVKESVWVTKCIPGPHPIHYAVPLRVLIRDLLKLARSGREADRIIRSGEVLIDGKVRKDPRFPVGLMDVVTIQKLGKNHRMLVDRHGRLYPVEIPEGESKTKLCMVVGKKMARGGKIQLSLHDGRNLLGDFKEVKRGDVVQISLEGSRLLNHLKMREGVLALIAHGKNPGILGRVVEIKRTGNKTTAVLDTEGSQVKTPIEYAFVVGIDSPLITIPGGGERD